MREKYRLTPAKIKQYEKVFVYLQEARPLGNECYRFILRAGWIFNVAKHKTSLDGKYSNIVEREMFLNVEVNSCGSFPPGGPYIPLYQGIEILYIFNRVFLSYHTFKVI